MLQRARRWKRQRGSSPLAFTRVHRARRSDDAVRVGTPAQRKRVVSVTPLSLDADSRSLKVAYSLWRLGYESIVLEGRQTARLGQDPPFEVIFPTPAFASPQPGDDPGVDASTRRGRALARRTLGVLPARVQRGLAGVVHVVHSMLTFRRIHRETKRVLPEADLYYLHSFQQSPVIRAAARRLGVPFVYDAHDYYTAAPAGTWDDRALQAYFRFVERRCMYAAAEVVTVGNGVASLIKGRFGRQPLVIRNAADSRLDLDASPTVRDALGLDAGAFLFVMPANAKRCIPYESVFEALRRAPRNVHFAFIGRGYDVLASALRDSEIAARTHFLSAVPPQTLKSFISSADAAVIAYYDATLNELNVLPNGFFHSIAAGLPVLYPPLPELHALGEQFELGIEVDMRDPVTLANAIGTLAGDPSEMDRLRAGVRDAVGHLSWAEEETRLAELIARLIGPPEVH